jgi:DNA-binding beta-propeller fold protein YncE
MPNRPLAAWALAIAFVAGVASSCGFGESGVPPPLDRVFLPQGVAADPGGRFLYVVNSNSDLRFNAGTIVAVDVARAGMAHGSGEYPRCPSPGFLPDNASVALGRACCWDYFDERILNCDDRLFIDPGKTVRIGSFGSQALIEPRTDLPGVSSRLYVAVRAEPSVTFLDVVASGSDVNLRCTSAGGSDQVCEDNFKIRGDYRNPAPTAVRLWEEPNSLAFDSALGLLYVGHSIEGLSVIDVCGPMPSLRSVNRSIFTQAGFGITAVTLDEPGNPARNLLVSGRSLFGGFQAPAAEVHSIALRGAGTGCPAQGEGPRNVEAVESGVLYSSAFYANGIDIHDVVQSPSGDRAYLLHRNAGSRLNPPAVVEVDRSVDAQGKRLDRSVAVIETCAGPTEMHMHDAGRGPRLYVVCFEAGQIYIFDLNPLTLTDAINVGRGPTRLVFSPTDPKVGYVIGFSDNNVSVLDLSPDSPTENRVIQRIGFPQLRKR